MFFSAKEFHNCLVTNSDYRYVVTGSYDTIPSLKEVRSYLKTVKQGIINRQSDVHINGRGVYLAKWLRPWDVVPKLAQFSAPEGDYGVGVEIEMGFVSRDAASSIVSKISNWKYVAVDIEGGSHPIEATFAPFCYSKMSSKSQPFRYLKLLEDSRELLVEHSPGRLVGTHVNVSAGNRTLPINRIQQLDRALDDMFDRYGGMSEEYRDLATKYFGRIPYGTCYSQGYAGRDRCRYVEYKLFNSTPDRKALRKYINIAVSLTALIDSNNEINETSVLAALEAGYNKR